MELRDLIDEIMGDLNFNELEKREIENGCDFDSTLEHYRSVVRDSIKDKAEYFNEEEFDITDESIKDIVKEIQERIDNDYSCEPNKKIVFTSGFGNIELVEEVEKDTDHCLGYNDCKIDEKWYTVAEENAVEVYKREDGTLYCIRMWEE